MFLPEHHILGKALLPCFDHGLERVAMRTAVPEKLDDFDLARHARCLWVLEQSVGRSLLCAGDRGGDRHGDQHDSKKKITTPYHRISDMYIGLRQCHSP